MAPTRSSSALATRGSGVLRKRRRGSANKVFYRSHKLAAAQGGPSVEVTLTLDEAAGKAWAGRAVSAKVQDSLRRAAAEFFQKEFQAEMAHVIDAYRAMLQENMAKGENPELREALNRARLQERILASSTMVEQAQACELLGLSTANPSATMKRKEERREVLRFTRDGRAVYPLFQFDVEGRRMVPGLGAVIAAKPENWSDFRLLYWLTHPHVDFDGPPSAALARSPDEVLAAFKREIEPPVHG